MAVDSLSFLADFAFLLGNFLVLFRGENSKSSLSSESKVLVSFLTLVFMVLKTFEIALAGLETRLSSINFCFFSSMFFFRIFSYVGVDSVDCGAA